MSIRTTRFVLAGFLAAMGTDCVPQDQDMDFTFDGPMARRVLESYLARSVTAMDLLTGAGDVDDNIRMLRAIGAKFAGRAIYCWGHESLLPEKLNKARAIEPRLRAAIPDIILQAGVFEIVTTDIETLRIPERVWQAFDLPSENRPFDYHAMLFPNGRFVDHWRQGASVPDMTQIETRMWFYHAATEYIDAGCEAIHFGQVALVGAEDKDYACWWDMLARVRGYAREQARRHGVLCDAHTPDGGPRHDGDRLLFDFHSFPLRIEEVADKPQEGVLQVGYLDSLFQRSNGGLTANGWRCDHLPYLVELDNWGSSGRGGQNIGKHWCWGWDEISWFAHQPKEYRDRWLRYAWDWVRENDPNGYLQMPCSRCLHDPVTDEAGNRVDWYFANNPSPAVPHGFGQEDAIRDLWKGR